MNDHTKLKRSAEAAKTRGPWIFTEVYCPQPKQSTHNPYWRDIKYCVAEFRHRHDGSHLRDIYYKEDAEFHALADPDTVLALIAENEALRKECDRLAENNRALLESPGDAL